LPILSNSETHLSFKFGLKEYRSELSLNEQTNRFKLGFVYIGHFAVVPMYLFGLFILLDVI